MKIVLLVLALAAALSAQQVQTGQFPVNSTSVITPYTFATMPTCTSTYSQVQALATDVGSHGTYYVCQNDPTDGYEWTPINGQTTLNVVGTPSGIAPSGSFANNGVYTTTNTLPRAYTTGVWLYFKAAAIASGSAAGSYWSVCTTTQACTVYNNLLATTFATFPAAPTTGQQQVQTDGSVATTGSNCAGSGSTIVMCQYNGTNWVVTQDWLPASAPATPTPFVVTGSGAFTQTTAAFFPVTYYQVQAGLMGPRGAIQTYELWDMTSNTDTKTFGTSFGSATTPIASVTNATSGNSTFTTLQRVQNEQSSSIQEYFNWTAFGGAGAINSSTNTTGTTPTAMFRFVKLGTASDSIVFENGSIQLLTP